MSYNPPQFSHPAEVLTHRFQNSFGMANAASYASAQLAPGVSPLQAKRVDGII
jgi:hypothetical protein